MLPFPVLGDSHALNFICVDAIASYRQIRELGTAVRRPFVGNGMWVTSIKDPDRHDLHFESLTDVPEGTEHTE